MSAQKTIVRWIDSKNYIKKAYDKIEKGQYESALSYLFTLLNKENNLETVKLIAQVYDRIGEFDRATKYWLSYLSACPKEEKVQAYEGLIQTLLEDKDFLYAGVYMHCLLQEDNSQENKERLLEFSTLFMNKDNSGEYYLAYSNGKENYQILNARISELFLRKKYNQAVDLINSLPPEEVSDQVIEEFSLEAYFRDDLDRFFAFCKSIILANPNNMTALCNLSSVAKNKGNLEKAKYYYGLAKSKFNGSVSDCYSLTDCAIEQGDHAFICTCIESILAKENQSKVIFPYAIALANLGKYEMAYENISKICRLFPDNRVYSFYAKYIYQLIQNGKDIKGYLPFEYKEEFPKPVCEEFASEIDKIFDNLDKLNSTKKRKEYLEILEWGVKNPNIEISHKSIVILSIVNTNWSRKVLFDCLIDTEVSIIAKQKIIRFCFLAGYRGKFTFTVLKQLIAIKPPKLDFENKTNSSLFVQGYANALSRMNFYPYDNLKVLNNSASKVYEKLCPFVKEKDLSQEEITCLILQDINYNGIFNNKETIRNYFEVDTDKIKELTKIINGDKND